MWRLACAAFGRGAWEGSGSRLGARGLAGKAKAGKGKGGHRDGPGEKGKRGSVAPRSGGSGYSGAGSVRPGVYTGTATSKGLSGVSERELRLTEAKRQAETTAANIEKARKIIEGYDAAARGREGLGKGKSKGKGEGKGLVSAAAAAPAAGVVGGEGAGRVRGQGEGGGVSPGVVREAKAKEEGAAEGRRKMESKEGAKEGVVAQKHKQAGAASTGGRENKDAKSGGGREVGRAEVRKKGRKAGGAQALSPKALEAMRKAEEAAMVQERLEARWGGRLPTFYSLDHYPRDPMGVNPHVPMWDVRAPSRKKMTHTRFNGHVFQVKRRIRDVTSGPELRAMSRAFNLVKQWQRGEGVYREIMEKKHHQNGAVKRRRRLLHERYFAKKRAIKVNVKHVLSKIKWDAEEGTPLKNAF